MEHYDTDHIYSRMKGNDAINICIAWVVVWFMFILISAMLYAFLINEMKDVRIQETRHETFIIVIIVLVVALVLTECFCFAAYSGTLPDCFYSEENRRRRWYRKTGRDTSASRYGWRVLPCERSLD